VVALIMLVPRFCFGRDGFTSARWALWALLCSVSAALHRQQPRLMTADWAASLASSWLMRTSEGIRTQFGQQRLVHPAGLQWAFIYCWACCSPSHHREISNGPELKAIAVEAAHADYQSPALHWAETEK